MKAVPFSYVTFFETDITLPLSGIADMASLQAALNEVVGEHGANLFYMVKISGVFSSIKVRSESKRNHHE